MRLSRNCLVVISLVLGATPTVLAQHSAGLRGTECGCGTCGAGYRAQGCCPSLVSSVTQGIHDVLGCLFCCPGLNARHDIYRAALNRNDFGKCNKFVPIYTPQMCCCGRVSQTCPSCGPAGGMPSEEVLEMQDVPEGMPLEPTPAVEPGTPPTPAGAVPPQARRSRTPSDSRPAAAHRAAPRAPSTKTAREATKRDRIVRAEVRDETPRGSQPSTSLIQRTMLPQTGATAPAVRK